MRFDTPVIYGTSYKGKLYIGQHIGNGANYVGSGTIISNIKKSGKSKYLITGVIEYVNDVKKLDERERYWIAKLKPELNLTQGGEGTLGSPRPKSKKIRKQISEKLKGRIFTKEHKKQISLALKNKKKSDNHIKNLKKSISKRDYSLFNNPKCKNKDMIFIRFRNREKLNKKWSVVIPNKKEVYFYDLVSAKKYRNKNICL